MLHNYDGYDDFEPDYNIEAVYEEFVKNFGFYEKGHVEPKFPQEFISELYAVFPNEMSQYYKESGGVCGEADFLVNIGLFNAGHGWKYVTAKPLEELKLKNRKTLSALCGAYNKFKQKQKEAKQIQEAKDKVLKEFYENFASLFCGQVPYKEKGLYADANHAMLLTEMYDVLNKFYPTEMESIKSDRYNYDLGNAHARPIYNTWMILQTFGLANGRTFGTVPKSFEELDARAKEVLLKFKEKMEHCNIGMKKISVASKTGKGIDYRYFLERNVGNGNKVSYDPRQASIMVLDGKGNGLCYYGDGYVNPVRNGKTFPNEGTRMAKEVYQRIRDCFGTGNFGKVKQYLPVSVVKNGLFQTPVAQKTFSTFKMQKNVKPQTVSTYVQIPINNRGDYVSFNPKNPTSIMTYNKNTGFGYCYYPDGYVNPVRNMQTIKSQGMNFGNQGRMYFYNLLQQARALYRIYSYNDLNMKYQSNNKNISQGVMIGTGNINNKSNNYGYYK